MVAELVLKAQVIYEDVEIHHIFDVCTYDKVDIPADITDQYVENNTAIQDHMALKPLSFTLKGYAGEKVFTQPLKITDKIASSFDKLKPISALLPTMSNYMQVVIAGSSFIEENYNRLTKAHNLKNLFNKDKTTNNTIRQSEVVNNLLKLRDARVLVDINNDFGNFSNYLIENAYLEQKDTRSMSEVVVVLKQFRGVSTELTKIDFKKYAERYAIQRAVEENLGRIQGQREFASSMYKAYEGGQTLLDIIK